MLPFPIVPTSVPPPVSPSRFTVHVYVHFSDKSFFTLPLEPSGSPNTQRLSLTLTLCLLCLMSSLFSYVSDLIHMALDSRYQLHHPFMRLSKPVVVPYPSGIPIGCWVYKV